MKTINSKEIKRLYIPPMVIVHKIMDEGILAGTPNATGGNMTDGDGSGGNGDIEDDED